MFENVKAAGLQPHDLAKLLRVNRITTSMWLNGHTEPHHLHRQRVEKLVDAIGQAVQAGALPVPLDVSRRERGLYIRRALSPYWQDA